MREVGVGQPVVADDLPAKFVRGEVQQREVEVPQLTEMRVAERVEAGAQGAPSERVYMVETVPQVVGHAFERAAVERERSHPEVEEVLDGVEDRRVIQRP